MDGLRDCHTEEVSQTKIYHMILLTCGLFKKNGTNEPIYKKETESQAQKTDLQLPRGKGGRDKLGDWD